jgi:hypothetical protein
MPRTLGTPRHEAFRQLLIEARRKAQMTQTDVARALRRHQSFVATVETGQRRVDVVELLDFAEAIGFDPASFLRKLRRVSK